MFSLSFGFVDLIFSLQPVMQTQVDASQLTSAHQEQFAGFTFEAPSVMGP